MKNILYLTTALLVISCQKSDNITTTNADTTTTATVVQEPKNQLSPQVMLDLINQKRISGCNCGTEAMPPVPTLVWNDKLELAATRHSDDMNTKKYFNHISLDGRTPETRVTQAGYTGAFQGENITLGATAEVYAVGAWINSPSHCKNIMNSFAKEVGVGRVGDYWTQDFGR